MAKGNPQPFYWQARSGWYLDVDGKRYRLGPDREAAWARYFEIMHQRAAKSNSDAPKGSSLYTDSTPVLLVLEEFLAWARTHQADTTRTWYRQYLLSFARSLDPALPLSSLAPYHAQSWLDAHPHWASSTRRSALVAIRRPFCRACKLGLLARNPLSSLALPEAGRRELTLTDSEYQTLLADTTCPCLGHVLRFIWETGCRPQEVPVILVEHLDLGNSRIVLPKELVKGKKRPRIILLNERTLLQVKSLLPCQGNLFKDPKGRPWTSHTLNSALRHAQAMAACRKLAASGWAPDEEEIKQLAQKRGLPLWRIRNLLRTREARKEATRFCLYNLRHSFCTRALVAGINPAVVAELMGHRDATMVLRVYQHLSQRPDHLLGELKRLG